MEGESQGLLPSEGTAGPSVGRDGHRESQSTTQRGVSLVTRPKMAVCGRT